MSMNYKNVTNVVIMHHLGCFYDVTAVLKLLNVDTDHSTVFERRARGLGRRFVPPPSLLPLLFSLAPSSR